MKKASNIDIMHGLKNDIIISLPELLERIFEELEKVDKRLKSLEKRKT